MKEQNNRPRHREQFPPPLRSHRNGVTPASSDDPELLDDDARDPVFNFSDKHKLLQLRLRPLVSVQKALEMYLRSATLEPTNTHPPGSTGRNAGVFVSANNSWRTRLSGKEASRRFIEKRSIKDIHDATEILEACGSDIKQLWTDDVVQQVLKGTKAQLENSPGL